MSLFVKCKSASPETSDSFVFVDALFRIVGDVSFFRGDASSVMVLNHLFLSGDPLPPPAFPLCGDDPTEDSLPSKGYPSCE